MFFIGEYLWGGLVVNLDGVGFVEFYVGMICCIFWYFVFVESDVCFVFEVVVLWYDLVIVYGIFFEFFLLVCVIEFCWSRGIVFVGRVGVGFY